MGTWKGTPVTLHRPRLTLGTEGAAMALQVREDMQLWKKVEGSPSETHLEWGL